MGKFCSMERKRLTSLVLITHSAACDCIHISAFLLPVVRPLAACSCARCPCCRATETWRAAGWPPFCEQFGQL